MGSQTVRATVTGIPTLIGAPFDGSSSFQRGPAQAPAAIRAALQAASSNSWTEDGLDLAVPGMLADAGDSLVGPDANSQVARLAIEEGVSRVLAGGGRPLVLGGDHSITYPVLRAMARAYQGLTIVHFDAHGDLYDHYLGDRYSHACPFARIMEESLASRLLQYGIRTLSQHQRDQAARWNVEIREMRHWTGPESLAIAGPVYLSVDLDVLDPAYIGGINHPEPGGLSVREVITMIQQLDGDLVGADVVELSPPQDSSPRSALVAAKIVKELAAAMHRSRWIGDPR